MWGIPTCTPSAGSSSPPRRSCPLPACGWDVAPRRATPSPTRVRGCGRRRCVQSPLRSLCTRAGPAVSVTSEEHTLLSRRREGSDGSLGQDRYCVASGGNFQNKGSLYISEMKKQSVMWKVPRSHTWINKDCLKISLSSYQCSKLTYTCIKASCIVLDLHLNQRFKLNNQSANTFCGLNMTSCNSLHSMI